MATGGMNLSREFFDLLKQIGESKSKQEEDRIIVREISRLKHQMETPQSMGGGGPSTNILMSSKKRAKEFLVRLLYVEMLGHDASFGYIKAVEMAASSSLYHKRTGYLLCSACLSPDHEFRFMLVNQMQRDLQSTNILEICGGLLAATSIITTDMVPAVQGEVNKLISHDSDTVRKKSIVTMHRFHQLAPEAVTREDLCEKLRKVLCDKDPAVMGSCLNVIEALSIQKTDEFKELIPSLISILKQIGEQRLPSDFNYHRVSAPWIQMKIIRILGLLGKADASASSEMYEILADRITKADAVGVNAGYAIVFECIKTIATIYPNPKLLDMAGDAISRFIGSRSHNLKYLGVTGLAMIVETNPQYAAQHQLAVMDCLEDPDETLQRKTLDLLYRMTNPVNVEFITERMIEFMMGTTDLFLKNVLTTRICAVAERYAPNNAWYIRIITRLFEVSGDMVPQQVAQNLMSLIAEGAGESDEADMLLRQNAVEIYVSLLQESGSTKVGKLPRILLETMAWTLGEYGYLSAACPLDDVLAQLCALAKTAQASKLLPTTRKFLLAAIMKLIAQMGTCSPQAAAVIDEYTKSRDVDLQQRCLEFQAILTTAPQILAEILPVDASAEDIEVDTNLNFMNEYVSQAMANGARPYEQPEDDDDDILYDSVPKASTSTFKMTPYEKPTKPTGGMPMHAAGSAGPLPPGAGGGPATGGYDSGAGAAAPKPGGMGLNTRNVANVWGKGGMASGAAAPQPAAVPTSPTTATSPAATKTPSAFAQDAYATAGAAFPTSSAPPKEVPKTKEQLEKERMAAALFGGIVPGAPVPAPTPASAPVAAPPPPKPAAAPKPAAKPVPAPEIDLLDMMGFDAPAPAPAGASGDAFDVFAPAPLPAAPAAAPAVETVSDDEDADVAKNNTVVGGTTGSGIAPVDDFGAAPAAAAPAAAPSPSVDPFEAAGLLGDDLASGTSAPTLAGFGQADQKFEYQGAKLAPLEINTAQFGQNWGTCTCTSPTSIMSSKVSTLSEFMSLCSKVGAHNVEAIATTNEGICAGMVGANCIILIHGKVSPGGPAGTKIDVTVKSTDQAVSGSLAMYLQTMLR